MKNKIKVIDISIVSTYMGRYLTAVVVVLVLAITLSALLTRGGLDADGIIVVGVAPRGQRGATFDHYEPLRALLERRTGAMVRLQVCDSSWPESCDLLVMSVHEFRRVRESHGLVATCSVEPAGGMSAAAIIAAGSVQELPLNISGGDVMYTAPHSINGCWLQLRALEERGAVEVRPLQELVFAPPPGHAERVVYDVVAGRFRMGAVPRGVVTRMIAEGKVARDEVSVVLSLPALPETVLCRRDRGTGTPAWLRDLGVADPENQAQLEPVLRAVDEDEMKRLDSLFEYVLPRR